MSLPRFCAYDLCGQKFQAAVHNQVYCQPKCKRNAENRRRNLDKPVQIYDESVWQAEELRKLALAERRAAKDSWILANKSFASFDIESTQLDADFGRMLCAVIKPLGGTSKVFEAATDDAKMVGRIRDEIEKYDYLFTWYGTGFDAPFLQTRLLLHGERPLGFFRHLDMYYTARGNMKFASNRLSMVTLSLFGRAERTPVVGKIWDKASIGDRSARQYIIEHCLADVNDLENVSLALLPYRNISATPIRGVGRMGPYEQIKEAKL